MVMVFSCLSDSGDLLEACDFCSQFEDDAVAPDDFSVETFDVVGGVAEQCVVGEAVWDLVS
jgi:hypothetical protein